MSDKPPRSLWKRLALASVILGVIAVAAFVGVSLWTGGVFGRRLAAIRAAGDPASIADLAPQPIPAEQNSAAVIDGLAPRIDAFSNANGAFYKTDVGKAYDAARERGDPPAAEQLAAISAILEQFPELNSGAERAAACPQFAPIADFSLDSDKFVNQMLARIQQFRSFARYQAWEMEVLIGHDQRDEAIKRGIVLLRLAKLHEAEPASVSYLVSLAVRYVAIAELYDALEVGPLSTESHAALEAELAQQAQSGALGRMLRTERAFNISSIDSQAAQTGKIGSTVARMVLRQRYAGMFDMYDALLPVADLPWYDSNSPWPPGGRLKAPTHFGVLADLLTPALQAASQAHFRDVAQVSALRVFNALRVFAEKNGREAAGLADLELPSDASIDPFTGQPLMLKSTPEGWIIYSIGAVGDDDGGDLKNQKDCGVGPPKLR